ncbi:ArnT family glycosyltransferase [Streptomyces halobius]|uniref:Dolichyl-phosphate-mannose-protein mannosyltransferase n=1 Tax=Streptomyces halobius TaxID=2879846 RepID=A0ABY4LZA1_9ACTN|nr:hypothetical protein [Streptomyces halobius]UQA90816.1 hypothetical protein K9S39_01990 [Streptomyces halobius]
MDHGVELQPRPADHIPSARPSRTPRRALPWLAGVALAFVAVQLVLVVPGSGLGWDEIVYVSQVQPGTPTAFFSAPRARGISYLVAPVAALTASTTALRVYLAVLSGLGLFLALWVWRRLVPPPVLGCAGLLFASLWVTLFYGPRAMPNLWCALGALAATGWFLRAARARADRAALVGVGAALAFVTVLRPTDGVGLAAPLLVAAVVVRPWRRFALPAVLVAGIVVGAAPWVVEAYLSYGGLTARMDRASEIQGGMGWHIAVDDQVRSLGGRTLCRPCGGEWTHPWTAVWWFALPVLAACGVACARIARRGSIALLAVAAAVTLAWPYLFSIDYAAPRFLLPAYALLALPVAECVVWCFTRVRPAPRTVAGAAMALGLVGHLAVQFAVLTQVDGRSRARHQDLTAIGAQLERQGVRPPCVVTGEQAIPVAYYTGCTSRQLDGHDESITQRQLLGLGRRMPLVVITKSTQAPPSFARDWHPSGIPDGYLAWISPRPS